MPHSKLRSQMLQDVHALKTLTNLDSWIACYSEDTKPADLDRRYIPCYICAQYDRNGNVGRDNISRAQQILNQYKIPFETIPLGFGSLSVVKKQAFDLFLDTHGRIFERTVVMRPGENAPIPIGEATVIEDTVFSDTIPNSQLVNPLNTEHVRLTAFEVLKKMVPGHEWHYNDKIETYEVLLPLQTANTLCKVLKGADVRATMPEAEHKTSKQLVTVPATKPFLERIAALATNYMMPAPKITVPVLTEEVFQTNPPLDHNPQFRR